MTLDRRLNLLEDQRPGRRQKLRNIVNGGLLAVDNAEAVGDERRRRAAYSRASSSRSEMTEVSRAS